MSILIFLLRLLALPFCLVFLLVGGAAYVIATSLMWTFTGEQVTIYIDYPEWN